MSVIYRAKILLKTGYGYPGNILESGEFGYDVSTNKAWIGNGIGIPPTGFTMDPSFVQLYNIVNNLSASTGNYATYTYVDGSFNDIRAKYIPDSSLSNDFFWDASSLLNTNAGGGASISGSLRFNSTLSGDPGTGKFGYNDPSGLLTTIARVSYIADSGANIKNVLLLLSNGDKIYFQNDTNPNIYDLFNVTGSVSDNGTYGSIPVGSDKTGGTFTNNSKCNALLIITGSNSIRQYVDATFATNSSVNLYAAKTDASIIALQNADKTFATNASVNSALFTTNSSFGAYATNASVGIALGKYIPNASLGTDFFWQAGLLEVSIGSILSPGTNLTIDSSGKLSVVNSPNFSGDVSIQGNLFVDQRIRLKDFSLSNASTGDLWYQSPRLFFRDGSTNRDLLQGALKGTVYPASPSEGDTFYRTDNGIQFVYDGSRAKYLSVTRQTLNCGRTSAVAGTTTYMRVGDGTQSSTAGFRMFRNGTITAFSVDQNTTLTAARSMQVRINDVSSLVLNIPNGGRSVYTNQGNVDFVEGDVLTVVAGAGAGGSGLNNVIAVIELAWRS